MNTTLHSHLPPSRTRLRCPRPLAQPALLSGLAAVFLAAFPVQSRAQSYTLSNTWAMVGATNNLDVANDNRGMAYGMTNQVFVNNKGTHAISVYDGNSGSSNGVVNITGVSGGNFTINKLGVSADGVLYGANLNTSVGAAGSYKVYRWADWSQPPTTAYAVAGGDPVASYLTGKRMGDTLAISGSGTGTLMLAGVGGTNAFVLLSSTDGVNFTATVLAVSGLPTPGSGVQFGFAFYTNNTFMVVPAGGAGTLYLVSFPANFASLPNPVAATVVASLTGLPTGTTGNWLDLSYNPTAGLLATHPNASSAISLYRLPSTGFAGLAQLATTALSFNTSQSINGNETGDVALGGTGLTNAIYTLDTSAGLQATAIGFAPAPIPPTITAEPVGATLYTNAPSFTLTVSASGSLPLSYQWQFNSVSNIATASNIPLATNASYSITNPPLSASGWYNVVVTNVAGVTSSFPAQLTVVAPASSTVVTQLWSLAPGSRSYLATGETYDTRGLAYDPLTKTVLVADKSGANLGIYVLDADTAADKFAMNTLGIGFSGNQFPLDQVGVADDGAVYACNLVLAGSGGSFAVFSWSSVDASVAPAFAFQADPGNGSGDRWGDTMAVRGSGANTEILLGSYSGFGGGPSTNVALLTTPDGMNFNATLLTIPEVPAGFSSLGIAFGAGNTFWAKSPGFNLRQIAFDPLSGTGTVIANYATASSGISSFSSMSAIGVDPLNNIIGGVTFNDVPNNLSLYQISTNGMLPYLFDQVFFPSLVGNSQENGVTVLKAQRGYSLDVNNGVVAISYGVPPPPPVPAFSITAVSRSAGATSLTWQSYSGRSYQVLYKNSLTSPNWLPFGPPLVASGSTTSTNDTTAAGLTRFYRVQAQ